MNDSFAMMFETGEGTGEYKMVTQSNWPTEKYIFNANLSRCENGSKLSWDNTKKAVVFSGNVTDKCYVYFDMELMEKPLVDYVKLQYTGVQGENNIYYHDSSLTNGAGDNSYRYAGPSEEVNNFVCFGSTESPCPIDNLYRIIGVFGENYHGISGEQLVKLIKYDYANSNLLGTNGDYFTAEDPNSTLYLGQLTSITTYHWNYKGNTTINNGSGSNVWSTSLLNKTNLNNNYLNNIGIEWANKITVTTWKVGGNTAANIRGAIPSVAYQNEIVNPRGNAMTGEVLTYKAKIGLMYVSDYGFAASPSAWTLVGCNNDATQDYRAATNNNWMYMGYYDWTITPQRDHNSSIFIVDSPGQIDTYSAFYDTSMKKVGVRVVFNLVSFRKL